MKQKESHAPRKRGLYRRSSDEDIYFHVGTFPLITTLELAELSGRNPVSLRKRLRQLCLVNHLGRVEGGEQREEFFHEIACSNCGKMNPVPISDGKIRPKPFFYYLKPKGGDKARPLLVNPVIWKTDPKRVDHDRVVNTIHFSFDRAFGDQLTDWRQQKDDLKEQVKLDGETINFYPDGRCVLNDTFLYLEYANSEPSSANGVNDIVEKVRRYNQIMKHEKDAKVLFIFRERSQAENFVNRIADDFPYLWIYATDTQSIQQNPKGKIFWTPKDFDDRPHALIDDPTS